MLSGQSFCLKEFRDCNRVQAHQNKQKKKKVKLVKDNNRVLDPFLEQIIQEGYITFWDCSISALHLVILKKTISPISLNRENPRKRPLG
jgi:hypothetical protein